MHSSVVRYMFDNKQLLKMETPLSTAKGRQPRWLFLFGHALKFTDDENGDCCEIEYNKSAIIFAVINVILIFLPMYVIYPILFTEGTKFKISLAGQTQHSNN
jgi:hypothetical protein